MAEVILLYMIAPPSALACDPLIDEILEYGDHGSSSETSYHHHRRTLLRQPLLALGEIRHDAFDMLPEFRGVVGFGEVDEFVEDDVVDYCWGEEDGGPVEV